MQFPTHKSNVRTNLIRNFQGPYEDSEKDLTGRYNNVKKKKK